MASVTPIAKAPPIVINPPVLKVPDGIGPDDAYVCLYAHREPIEYAHLTVQDLGGPDRVSIKKTAVATLVGKGVATFFRLDAEDKHTLEPAGKMNEEADIYIRAGANLLRFVTIMAGTSSDGLVVESVEVTSTISPYEGRFVKLGGAVGVQRLNFTSLPPAITNPPSKKPMSLDQNPNDPPPGFITTGDGTGNTISPGGEPTTADHAAQAGNYAAERADTAPVPATPAPADDNPEQTSVGGFTSPGLGEPLAKAFPASEHYGEIREVNKGGTHYTDPKDLPGGSLTPTQSGI